jgi:hypothetical protein
MYSLVPTDSPIYTCAVNRYFGSPRRTCYKNSLLPLVADAFSRSLRSLPLYITTRTGSSSAGRPCHTNQIWSNTLARQNLDTRESQDVGLHPMLCVQLKSRFVLLNTATGPSRYMSRGPRPLAVIGLHIFPRCRCTDHQLSIRKEYTIPNYISREPCL